MPTTSIVVLTPGAAAVAVAALVPVAAALLGRARAQAVRRALRLPPPERRSGVGRLAALAGAVVLLGLAAAQPALTRESSRRVRSDAQALFVIDISRSMAASSAPGAPTRLARATAAATRLRAAIPDVEAGVATLTDRVLPDLLPVADESGFDAVVAGTVAVESPPPRETSIRATSFAALAAIPTGGYFLPAATTRVVVLLTDGESGPTATGEVARAFDARPGTALVAVRFWRSGEAVYGPDRKPEAAYRPDPAGRAALAALAGATRGRSFEEADVEGAVRAVRSAVGDGPTVAVSGGARTRTPLAPYLAALALLLLAAPACRPALAAIRGMRIVRPGLRLPRT